VSPGLIDLRSCFFLVIFPHHRHPFTNFMYMNGRLDLDWRCLSVCLFSLSFFPGNVKTCRNTVRFDSFFTIFESCFLERFVHILPLRNGLFLLACTDSCAFSTEAIIMTD
jgi:hypothetical protein